MVTIIKKIRIYLLQFLLLTAFETFCTADTKIRPEQVFRDSPINNNIALTQKTSVMSQSTFPITVSINTPLAPYPAQYPTAQQPQTPVEAYTKPTFPKSTGSTYFDDRTSDLISANVLRFAHDIGRQLSNNPHKTKNEVFSPLSIMSALALLMLGAKGKSYQQLTQLFGLYNDAELVRNPSKFHKEFALMLEDIQWTDENTIRDRSNAAWKNTNMNGRKKQTGNNRTNRPTEHVIKIANGLFAQSGFSLNPDYSYIIKSVYQSELVPLDFHTRSTEARNYINAWVNNKTFGKIRNIINNDIPKDTNVIIASALYFKGFWETPFFASVTVLDDFYPDGIQGPSVKVKMMGTGGILPFYDAVEYDCRIIGLPYVGNVTTMYIIQPNYSSRTKLKQLQAVLDAQKIEDMISRMTLKTAVLALPKMHFVRSLNMKDMLSRMGVTDIFSNNLCDLSLISNDQLYAAPQQHYPTAHTQNPAILQTTGPQYQVPGKENTFVFSPSAENVSSTPLYNVGLKQRRRFSRQTSEGTANRSFNNLEALRNSQTNNKSNLFVEDIVHKVDFDVNEYGTEAAAATLTYLRRSGTDVQFRADTPFMVLIRHDTTKLPLFYGIINEPES